MPDLLGPMDRALQAPFAHAGSEVWDPEYSFTSPDVVRCVSINTHRGEGPHLEYVKRGAPAELARRLDLLDATRAYSFHIAEWLRRHCDRWEVVALQEVFHGGVGLPLRGARGRQRDFYHHLAGFAEIEAHRVGFAGFRYENVLLSHLPRAPETARSRFLPGRVLRLAACGFTLAPFRLGIGPSARTVWIGNTHLHAYDPSKRMLQAAAIAREVRALGDVPVLFLGDLNTVPPGCKDGDFREGDRDVRSYKGDRTLEILARAGLRVPRHSDHDGFWTYPVGAANRTLDYVLASRHFEIESYRVVREFTLSDHYPVEGTFRLVR